MVEGSHGETTIKVVLFSGKTADWTTWEERFLAQAKRRGYKDLLIGKVEIPTEEMLEEEEDVSDDDLRQL
jgi:hypothetical protein